MGSETGVEEVSPTLTIHRRKDWFLPDPFNFGISLGFAGMVQRLIQQEKPDIVIVNKVLFWTSFSLIPLRITGTKVLLLTDALVGMSWWPRGLLPKLIMGLGAWTVGWLTLLCAHRIVFFHPQPPSLLKRLGIAGKSQVIPSGIDPAQYGPPSRNDNEVTVTYIGRLESVKGVDDLLAAVVPLKKNFSDLAIQVIGWYRDGHPLVAKYKDQVRFTGLRHDIADILRSTDIFVLPSYSEGLSNALMEAMASGCACIATEVGGNRFLIQNGISGFLFPVADREALAAHVRRLLDDPAKRHAMGDAARKRIEDQFSWEKIGRQYQELFRTLA
jgi:glycosyltransferase involved in cell wall biosynthesis